MTLTLVDWLQNGAIVLLLALVAVQINRANRGEERASVLQHWAAERDPDYWAERLGYDPDRPLLNDPPPPDGPPDCEEAGKLHIVLPGGGNVCQNCRAVLVAKS